MCESMFIGAARVTRRVHIQFLEPDVLAVEDDRYLQYRSYMCGSPTGPRRLSRGHGNCSLAAAVGYERCELIRCATHSVGERSLDHDARLDRWALCNLVWIDDRASTHDPDGV
jgi:hypothetical protein